MVEGGQQGVAQGASGELPRRIGGYRIDQYVGGGASGMVYRAVDGTRDRAVAIKVLRPEFLAEFPDKSVRRFAAHAELAKRCLHPNVVTVFDVLEVEDTLLIISEYVEAGTLETLIRSGALPPVRQVGEIMAQLLFGLDHANSKGVVHGNLRSANVFCPLASSIKVADYGVMQPETIDSRRLDRFGTFETLNYVAPERLLGTRANARADLFSAGVVLFELLTGKKPFAGSDRSELVRQLLYDVPSSLETQRPDYGGPIADVIRRALARNPEDRFRSAEEFVESLNKAIDSRSNDHRPAIDLAKLSSRARPNSAEEGTLRLSPTMAQKLAPGETDRLARLLAQSIGPIALLLVKRASQEATDADMLLSSLAGEIKIAAEAERFRRDAEQLLGNCRPAPRRTWLRSGAGTRSK
jgi:serine/threonine-protein kinase